MTAPIAPCLWFDNQAEEAVNFYVAIFPDSRVEYVGRFTNDEPDPNAPATWIDFRINGQPFQAINGGPMFSFSEAISFAIECADQKEVNYYWDALTKDGGQPGECGWLKDKYGVSWQTVPRVLRELLKDPDLERAGRVMQRMLPMQKLDVAELQAAYDG